MIISFTLLIGQLNKCMFGITLHLSNSRLQSFKRGLPENDDV